MTTLLELNRLVGPEKIALRMGALMLQHGLDSGILTKEQCQDLLGCMMDNLDQVPAEDFNATDAACWTAAYALISSDQLT